MKQQSLPVTDEGYLRACLRAASSLVMHIQYCLDADIECDVQEVFVGTDLKEHPALYSPRNLIAPSIATVPLFGTLSDEMKRRLELQIKSILAYHAIDALKIPMNNKYELENYFLEVIEEDLCHDTLLFNCLQLLQNKVDPVPPHEFESFEESVHFPALFYYFLEVIEDVRKLLNVINWTAEELQRYRGYPLEGDELYELVYWLEEGVLGEPT